MSRNRSAPNNYRHNSTEDISRWASDRSTFRKRVAQVDTGTGILVFWSLVAVVVGGAVAAFIYSSSGSWIVLLAAGVVLALPALSVIVFGFCLVMEYLEIRKSYRGYSAEIERRNRREQRQVS